MDSTIMELRLKQWLPIFEAQAESGLTKKDWCRENGIPRWQFYQRQKECREYLLEHKELPACTVPEFVELPLTATESMSEEMLSSSGVEKCSENILEIECGRFKIRLSGRLDSTKLESIIKAVANA